MIGLAIGAWLVPGAGHLLQGRTQKAVIFFITLVAMFAIGIASGGRLFPLQLDDPLVFLEAVAEWMLGVPRIVAGVSGFGVGDVTAVSLRVRQHLSHRRRPAERARRARCHRFRKGANAAMTSHVGMMMLFAACVSIVFAVLMRDEPRDQWRMGGRLFGGFVLGAYVAGWLLIGLFG